MSLLYLDCPSGVSGDMLLGALFDLGADADTVEAPLRSLPLGDWRWHLGTVTRAGQRATDVVVEASGAEGESRTLAQIEELLGAGALTPEVLRRAIAVFRWLGDAEARVHGVVPGQLHIHEVGRADAVIDVVGTILALDALSISDVFCSALPLATVGSAVSGHGPVPLPAPATLEILARAEAPIRAVASPIGHEQVTPTGAALVAELATFGRPAMRLRRVGVGAGTRDDPARPNVLRAWLATSESAPCVEIPVRPVVVLETNVDDVTPEQASFALERVREAGALDVWVSASTMKKGRNGMQITVVARPELEAAVAQALLREMPTLGVRVREERRYEAVREVLRVQTAVGEAAVKVRRLPGELPAVAAEFEDCAALARSSRRPIGEIYAIVEQAARAALAAEQ